MAKQIKPPKEIISFGGWYDLTYNTDAVIVYSRFTDNKKLSFWNLLLE